jgi:hypothetical protein
MSCFVCGLKVETIVDALVHVQETEDDDQHQRYLSATRGCGLTADIEQLASYRRQAVA